jgi:hypothetical protein
MNLVWIALDGFVFGASRCLGAWAVERYREHVEEGRPMWPLNAVVEHPCPIYKQPFKDHVAPDFRCPYARTDQPAGV